jgi:two-component sensor histidine kinase
MKDTAVSSAAQLRLLSSALGELARARTNEEVLEVAALAAHRACSADGLIVHMRGAEAVHMHVSEGRALFSPPPPVVATACADALRSGGTPAASVRIASINGGSQSAGVAGAPGPREMVTMTVGAPEPRAGVAVYWLKPCTPATDDLSVLSALASATTIALAQAQPSASTFEATREGSVATPRFYEFQRQARGLLASIRSIVRRTSRSRSSNSLDDYAAHLEGRLGSLARIHGFLVRVPESAIGVDLEELVWSEFLAQAITQDQVTVSGSAVRLSPKAAEALGLAIHELVMNSIKYGALGHVDGRVTVAWVPDPRHEGWIGLEWQETAPHLSASRAAAQRGFGFELIEKTLPYELGAHTSVALAPSGLSCMISFPPDAAGQRERT